MPSGNLIMFVSYFTRWPVGRSWELRRRWKRSASFGSFTCFALIIDHDNRDGANVGFGFRARGGGGVYCAAQYLEIQGAGALQTHTTRAGTGTSRLVRSAISIAGLPVRASGADHGKSARQDTSAVARRRLLSPVRID